MADNQLLNEIGDEIRESLKASLAQGDFSRLNEAISNSVNMVIDEATDKLEKSAGISNGRQVNVSTHRYSTYSKGEATRERQKQLEREREQRARERRDLYANASLRQKQKIEERQKLNELRKQMRSPDAIVENGKLLPTKFKAVGDNRSMLYIIFGAIGLSIFSVITFMVSIINETGSLMTPAFITCLCLMVSSIGMIAGGVSIRKMISRAKRYARICGTKMYSQLSRIAAATGMTEKEIRKDIKKMLKKGYYPEGYLDDEGTTLMLSESVYRDYTSMKSSQKAQAQAEAEAKLSNSEKSELDQMVEEGMEAVKKLHKLNENIPGEVISGKLDLLEDILRQIFERVKVHPEQMDRMHKLMDYYLPTMLKLVEAYAEYDKVSAPGKEILEAKSEIENTLDTINEAFVQLLNNLFQDSVWDVTSDAQVLTTMLTQEGLAKEPVLSEQGK